MTVAELRVGAWFRVAGGFTLVPKGHKSIAGGVSPWCGVRGSGFGIPDPGSGSRIPRRNPTRIQAPTAQRGDKSIQPASIPNVTLVVFQFVQFEERNEFFLESLLCVMFFLILQILSNRIDRRETN